MGSRNGLTVTDTKAASITSSSPWARLRSGSGLAGLDIQQHTGGNEGRDDTIVYTHNSVHYEVKSGLGFSAS